MSDRNTPSNDRDEWLEHALEDVLQPLARLCLGHGLSYGRVEEQLKRAFVRAARQARRQAGATGPRDVSQVATATGLHRREVARLSAGPAAAPRTRPSPATALLTTWLSDPAYQQGAAPRARLPRHGAAPSFDALAQATTRHVHPRSLLDELVRLQLVRLDEATDTVELLQPRVVPAAGMQRLYALLGANLGDHLAAATDNVLGTGPRHVEQAVFADGLSAASVEQIQQRVRDHWSALLKDLAPELQRLIDQDQSTAQTTDRRVRVGLYSYHDIVSEDIDAQPNR